MDTVAALDGMFVAPESVAVDPTEESLNGELPRTAGVNIAGICAVFRVNSRTPSPGASVRVR